MPIQFSAITLANTPQQTQLPRLIVSGRADQAHFLPVVAALQSGADVAAANANPGSPAWHFTLQIRPERKQDVRVLPGHLDEDGDENDTLTDELFVSGQHQPIVMKREEALPVVQAAAQDAEANGHTNLANHLNEWLA